MPQDDALHSPQEHFPQEKLNEFARRLSKPIP
jgi:hypothetical protein